MLLLTTETALSESKHQTVTCEKLKGESSFQFLSTGETENPTTPPQLRDSIKKNLLFVFQIFRFTQLQISTNKLFIDINEVYLSQVSQLNFISQV